MEPDLAGQRLVGKQRAGLRRRARPRLPQEHPERGAGPASRCASTTPTSCARVTAPEWQAYLRAHPDYLLGYALWDGLDAGGNLVNPRKVTLPPDPTFLVWDMWGPASFDNPRNVAGAIAQGVQTAGGGVPVAVTPPAPVPGRLGY